jgi:Reverse transcriptase (RNA-dependent DNA polymerase)
MRSIITPLLKKPTLDKENLSNNRPISNLSFRSKLTERVLKSRLESHLSANSIFNAFQSAYKKFHFTELALLSLYDNVIRAIGQQKLRARS